MSALSVISLPKAVINWGKFFAKARRTFQDLSSPAARSKLNVCIWFSSLLKWSAMGINDSKFITLMVSSSSWESCLKIGRISFKICYLSSLVANSPSFEAHALRTIGVSSLHSSMNCILSLSWYGPLLL